MPSKSAIYYTDCKLEPRIRDAALAQLHKSGLPIAYVSHDESMFGPRGPLAMFLQILFGLEHTESEIVYLCEHDVLYHPSHFAFVPPDPTKIYYNLNVWQLRASDGHCVFWEAKKVSQLCAYREVLVEHYRKRVELVEKGGFSMKTGYEPGSHHRPERVDDLESDAWWSEVPNVDIRHNNNLSKSKWSPSDFRDKRNCKNWQESDSIPGWGKTEGRFWEFLEDVSCGIITPNGLSNAGSS